MKFSLYTGVALLAVAAAAQGLDARDAEPEMDMDVADMVDSFLEERTEKGNPSRCNHVAKEIPKCARSTIEACNRKSGCPTFNYKCGCKHKAAITKCSESGVIKKCGVAKAEKAKSAAARLCKCAK